jgi:hypothetical protein
LAKPDLSEFGSTGLRHSGGTVFEEFLPTLRGSRGSRVYREMRDNDPVIGSILYAIEKVITRLDWRVDPFKDKSLDGETDPKDVEVAEFVDSCINDMSESWEVTLSAILTMLVFGYSYHEIVYKIRGGDSKDPQRKSRYDDGKIGWRKLPIRAQETLWQWMFDKDGGIQGMIQSDPSASILVRPIPIEKALLFRMNNSKNNPEGRSLLRNAYRPWYYKHRIEEIEAIGVERDLAGLPIAYLPPEYLSSSATADQVQVRQAVEQIVQNVKRNEQEGLVFPLCMTTKVTKCLTYLCCQQVVAVSSIQIKLFKDTIPVSLCLFFQILFFLVMSKLVLLLLVHRRWICGQWQLMQLQHLSLKL